MASFSSYAGAYDSEGHCYSWRCFATARIYDVSLPAHAKALPLEPGRRWVRRENDRGSGLDLVWMVDAREPQDFSVILAQVYPANVQTCPEPLQLTA